MTETKIRNTQEFRINPESESDFHKIYEDNDEEDLQPHCPMILVQDFHKLVV